MSDTLPAASAHERPDASPARRRPFFPGKLFGWEQEEPPALDGSTPSGHEPLVGSPTPARAEPAHPSEPASDLPRVTMPSDVPWSAPASAAGRAAVQLTFSFGVTALRLTPFFRLGSLDLTALSDVVALHFVAPDAAEVPLAAGISFQIEGVELDGVRLRSLRLRPLDEVRPMVAPTPRLEVGHTALTEAGDTPIAVTSAGGGATSMAVQLVGTFALVAIDFAPDFAVEALRLEPVTQAVLLRVVPSARPTVLDEPPSFEWAEVHLGDGARLDRVRLVPDAARPAA